MQSKMNCLIQVVSDHKKQSTATVRRRTFRFMICCLCGAAASCAAGDSPYQFKADANIKETYDSNVYLQDTDPGVAGAMPAEKGSWITTFTPRVAFDYTPCDLLHTTVSYAPDFVVFHNAHSEDYFAHRGGVTLGGKAEDIVWEQVNTIVFTDGSHLGPLFAKPQDVPAVGGIPLRERRDALLYRGSFKLTWSVGNFFLRPVGSAYIHDFRTTQKLRAEVPDPFIYVNFNDRQDVNGGLDLGYRIAEKTHIVAGYRYGRQDQYRGPSVFDATKFADSPFDSEYHRALAGIEGTPFPWLKLSVLGGPDIRTWADQAHQVPHFHPAELLYWIDASIAILPTKTDTITLFNRRYEQPAFTSQSVYEDITYGLTWRHKFDQHWAATAGFQAYLGDWQAPVNREDWIYTPSASLSYTWQKLTAELAWSYDWVESLVPNTKGREFTRHLATLGIKYSF